MALLDTVISLILAAEYLSASELLPHLLTRITLNEKYLVKKAENQACNAVRMYNDEIDLVDKLIHKKEKVYKVVNAISAITVVVYLFLELVVHPSEDE